MKKIYLAIVLILIFLAALVADWNIRQESAQAPAATMIRTRDDDILEIEIGYPGGEVPPEVREAHRAPGAPQDAGTAAGQRPIEERPREEPETGDAYHYYEVQSGDTLSEIAQKFLGTTRRAEEIMLLNGISDPKRIHPGDRLKIPRR